MALNVVGPLTKIRDHLAATSGIQAVSVGIPAAPAYQLTAAVVVAGAAVGPDDFDTEQAVQDYLCLLLYDVRGDVSAAEQALATALPLFKDRIDHDTTLGGTAFNARVHWELAGSPDYASFGAAETRVFPVLVTCDLTEPNPQVP